MGSKYWRRSIQRIVVKDIPDKLPAGERIKEIEAFMTRLFPEVRVRDVANFYRGKYSERSLSKSAYVEFSNSDVRREVLDRLGGTKGQPVKIKFMVGGKECKVRGALTENALKRNGALRGAADALKADSRANGKDVKIVWTDERGVTIDGTYAFTQDKTDLVGRYVGIYMAVPPS